MPFSTGHPTLRAGGLRHLVVLTPFLFSGFILFGCLLGENTLSWQFLGQPYYRLCLPSEYLNIHLPCSGISFPGPFAHSTLAFV